MEYGWANGYNYDFSLSYASRVQGSGIWYLATETITQSPDNVGITHNADGTKTIRLTATAAISGLSKSSTFYADVELPPIPRATACPNIDAYIGSTSAINLSPASSSFTQLHMVEVQ